MILRTGIRQISDTVRAVGFDAFYGFGALTPNMIGDHEVVSLFWRDRAYAQLVVRGEAPRDLVRKVTVHLPDAPFVLSNVHSFGPTAHGDSCWLFWRFTHPGAHGGEFVTEIH